MSQFGVWACKTCNEIFFYDGAYQIHCDNCLKIKEKEMKDLKNKQPRGDGKFVVKVEEHNKKLRKKAFKNMKRAGMAVALKDSEKEIGKTKIPKVKPQKKV